MTLFGHRRKKHAVALTGLSLRSSDMKWWGASWWTTVLLLLLGCELLLNYLIITKRGYTEIDWKAYMEEVEPFLTR